MLAILPMVDSETIQPMPEFQRARSRKNCTCGLPCFYCLKPQAGRHDHDHFPVPWRHGGRNTVPTCHRCHDLKDRVGIGDWPEDAQQAAGAGLATHAEHVLRFIIGRTDDDEYQWTAEDGAVILRAILKCTTAEARIMVAQTAYSLLDRFPPTLDAET